MYAAIGDPREAEDLYRRTLTEKEKMLMEDSMLGMDESMCEYFLSKTYVLIFAVWDWIFSNFNWCKWC